MKAKQLSNAGLSQRLKVFAGIMRDEGRTKAAEWCEEAAKRLVAHQVVTQTLEQIGSGKKNTLPRRLALATLTFLQELQNIR